MWEGGQNTNPYGWRRTNEIGAARLVVQQMEEVAKEISFTSVKAFRQELSARKISQVLNIHKNGTPN